MKIFSGDEFGIIRLTSTKTKRVIDKYGDLNRDNEIIKIYKSPLEENKDNFNLYITSKYDTYTLNWNLKKIISSFKNKENKNICSTMKNLKESNLLINGNEKSEISIINFSKENTFKSNKKLIPIENPNPNLRIKLSNIENSNYNKESIYLMYENTPLLLYNIEKEKIEFKGKNLPHDELGLRIPIYDTSLNEVKNNNRLIYVSTAYGEIRLYDLRASPKPSLNKKVSKYKINKIENVKYNNNNNIIIGDCRGYCAMLDIRKSFNPCKNFKGNAGSIRDIIAVEDKDIAIIGGFDRYVKWYDYRHGNDDKVFVKHKINSLCLLDFEENFEESEQSEIADSEFDKNSEGEDNEDESNESVEYNEENEDNEDNEDNEEDEEEEDNEEDEDNEDNEDNEEKEDNEDNEEENDNYSDEEEEEKEIVKEKKFLNKKKSRKK